MSKKELQEEFLGIISNVVIESDAEAIKAMQKKALKIIDELKDHINDDIEYSGHRMTALGHVIFFDTQGYGTIDEKRVSNKALLELEKAIKDAGGEASRNISEVITVREMIDMTFRALFPLGPESSLENTTATQPNIQDGQNR